MYLIIVPNSSVTFLGGNKDSAEESPTETLSTCIRALQYTTLTFHNTNIQSHSWQL